MLVVDKKEVSVRLLKIINEKFAGIDLRFSKAANLTSSTLKNYVDGKSLPGGENLARLAEAGGVTADWILTGAEDNKRDDPTYHGIERRKRRRVFNEEERRLFLAFEKADQRAKEDALFQLERHQSG